MTSTAPALKRKIGLLQATSINMIDMAGIGPFVMIYLVIQISGGPHFLYAWFIGALVVICRRTDMERTWRGLPDGRWKL